MPDFVPFRALRFAPGPGSPGGGDDPVDLTSVCSPPYDVIDAEDRAALLGEDPHNAVRLILPDRYEDATAALAAWRDEGVLVADSAPTFSVYRMTFTGDRGEQVTTTGVIGALALDVEGVIPHERTLPKAKSDRLELLRATRANLEPIWGISLAEGLGRLLATGGPPVAVAREADGTRHELFRIDDPEQLRSIRAVVAGAPLVLADGHHRFETSCAYRDERPATDLGAQLIMMLVVELADDQLCVRAIHRILGGIAGRSLRAELAAAFDVRDAGPNTDAGVASLERAMHDDGALGLVDADGLALLVPTDALLARIKELPGPLRDVDAARFDTARSGLGVLPADEGIELGYRNDAAAVAGLVRTGAAEAAVLLRPVTVDTIRAAAAAGVRMPEKTTFFSPKPRTGMVIRTFDDEHRHA